MKTILLKYNYIFIVLSFFYSCIPIKIAPNLEEGKVLKARRFIRPLGNRYAYVFEDPKKANEFFKYVNAKYQISYDDLDGNIKFFIDENSYYLTFYEINKETKTINLIPMVTDAVLEEKGYSPMFENQYASRIGKWYIAITVTDEKMKDCLRPKYEQLADMEKYLTELQEEYLTTAHYIEVYLKSK